MTQKNKLEERRSHPRSAHRVKVRPKILFGPDSKVENISLGGMKIHSLKKYSLGDVLRLQMSLKDTEWADTTVRVVWIREQEAEMDPRFDLGCEFIDLAFDVQNELWMLLDEESSTH